VPLYRVLGEFAARRVGAVVSSGDARRHQRGLAAHREAGGDGWWGKEPRWFGGDTPPRQHNRVTPLVDGAHYFPTLCAAIAGAQRYVYIAGWCLTPHMPLRRGSEQALLESQIIAALSAAAQRVPVRVLLWSGARALFQPDRLAVLDVVGEMLRAGSGDIQTRLDDTAVASHCHHQKAVAIDGRVAFVGGMDLTVLAGDRWDTPDHPLRDGPNWHDVQVQIEGEAVADVEANFRQRWAAVTGSTALPHPKPTPEPGWTTPVQVVRTIHPNTYAFAPKGIRGIEHAYREVIRSAKRLIYLENQYLWSHALLDDLITLIQRPPTPEFRIVLVLPLRAADGKWDNDQHVETLRAADRAGRVVEVYSLYTSGPAFGRKAFYYRPIYVHAKVALVDDEWSLVGSANMNLRGFDTDSELDAFIHDREFARTLRLRLWAEHLATTEEAIAAEEPATVVDRLWKGQADENERRMAEARGPLHGAAMRYQIGHIHGAWLLETFQALTLEH
jgi:phosphatidylserine/phosphatidylglycerophosphate/cardiolipin synthase-like enzyme